MKRDREYWRNPELAQQLSEEERKKVVEKFLRLLEKGEREEY